VDGVVSAQPQLLRQLAGFARELRVYPDERELALQSLELADRLAMGGG
jgi:hypothetical protein